MLQRNYRINTALLSRIAPAVKLDGGRDRHCDVISDVPLSLYLYADDVSREITVYTPRLLTNEK